MNNTEKVQGFFDAYTAHDTDEMLALCSQAATFRYVPLGNNGLGSVHKDALGVWKLYIDAFPDFSVKLVSVLQAQNETIVCETLQGGTQTKDVGNIKNKGRKQYTPHLFLFQFNKEGLIEKITAFWDNDTIYAQLGHTEQHD